MEQKEIFELPYPTSQTITGPKLRFESAVLEVEYDFEKTDGSVEFVKINFQNPIAIEFTQEAVCTPEDLEAYNKIVKYVESNWLLTIRERWKTFLGKQANSSKGISFAHWKIYFNDAGCVNVIAESFTIN